MSYLARLKQLENSENLNKSSQENLPKPPKPPFGSFGSTNPANKNQNFIRNSVFSHDQEVALAAWLTHIDEPAEDHGIVLDKCRSNLEALAYYYEQVTVYEREKQLQNILNLLAINPDKKRVYKIDTKTKGDNVILTFAIRGVATFDMLIPENNNVSLLQEIIENETHRCHSKSKFY